jgi:hypothetical protein
MWWIAIIVFVVGLGVSLGLWYWRRQRMANRPPGDHQAPMVAVDGDGQAQPHPHKQLRPHPHRGGGGGGGGACNAGTGGGVQAQLCSRCAPLTAKDKCVRCGKGFANIPQLMCVGCATTKSQMCCKCGQFLGQPVAPGAVPACIDVGCQITWNNKCVNCTGH